MKNYELIITNIYKQYNPEKVSSVSDLLRKYSGQEESLLEALFQKYNISENQRLQFFTDIEGEKTVQVESKTDVENNDVNRTAVKTPNKANLKPFIFGGIALVVVVILLIVIFGSPKNTASDINAQDSTLVNQTADSVVDKKTETSSGNTESLTKNRNSVDAKSTINRYYQDLKSEDFDANRYFTTQVDRFISMKNTTADEINKYVVTSYYKNYKNNDYTFEDGSYEERSLDNGDTEASFIEVGTCYKVRQDKDLFTRLKMVVYLNPEGKIYKWLQTAVLEKR